MTQAIIGYILGLLTGWLKDLVPYFLKRRAERKTESETIDRDKRRLEVTTHYLELRDQWEPTGIYIEPPASIAGSITKSLSPEEWYLIAARMNSHLLRAVHTSCMYLEYISVKYPEYLEVVLAHRGEFIKWYDAMRPIAAVFDNMPPLVAKAIHAYYYRITDQSDANFDGFFAAMEQLNNAIQSGEITIEENEITSQLIARHKTRTEQIAKSRSELGA